MQAIAAIEQPSAPAPHKGGKAGRISPALRRAIDALVTGEAKTQKDAAALAGLAPEHLCRMLQKPQVQVFYEQRTRQTIGRAMMTAAARTVALMHAESEHVSLDASKHVLAIGNIRPPDQGHSVNLGLNVQVGYVIDLTPAAHTPQAPNTAQVIDNVESEER